MKDTKTTLLDAYFYCKDQDYMVYLCSFLDGHGLSPDDFAYWFQPSYKEIKRRLNRRAIGPATAYNSYIRSKGFFGIKSNQKYQAHRELALMFYLEMKELT